MNREHTINSIIEYFENNEEIFNSCIEELDSYNGYLNDDRFYEMEMLQDFYHGTDPVELLQRAFFGHDEDTWHTNNHGEKEYGPFNPNREYFYYNGYGNLVSTNYKDYSVHLDRYLIENLSENRCYIDTIEEHEELTELFDKLEEEQEQ